MLIGVMSIVIVYIVMVMPMVMILSGFGYKHGYIRFLVINVMIMAVVWAVIVMKILSTV